MRYRIVYLLLVTLIFWAGEAPAEKDSVVYRLKWLANMSTVGDYYAQSQGYFHEHDLDVTIKPGGPERDAIRELELGYAQFGVASADQVIRALSKGARVVVVAQLFQVNPLQWIYRSDRISLKGLDDLRGRTLGVTFGKNDEIIMRTLLARAKIDDSEVKLYSVRLDYAPFFKGTVDLWPVYVNTQGIEISARMEASGEKIRFFDPNQHGVQFVANSVVTSEALIKRRPDLVRRFVAGLLKGWREAMKPGNSEKSIAVVRSADQDTTLEIMKQQLTATRVLIKPSSTKAIGAIDRAAWQQTEEMMLHHKQIQGPVTVLNHLMTDLIR